MSEPTLLDSRRLPGPNIISPNPGAVLDIAGDTEAVADVMTAWTDRASAVLARLGWTEHRPVARRTAGGASLLLEAPIDALYAATEVNEWVWEAARAAQRGNASGDDDASALDRLRATIAAERNPALLALRDAARARGVAFLSDDDHASVGLGTGSLTWPVDALPDPGDVPWDAIHDIPTALVTGSNGKTTTVRILTAMVRAAARVPGTTSTDAIEIAGEVVETGDWSGPGGARRVLRDRRVEVAILETARGGMLRRGLALERATAALITNIAEDHLGEFGVGDAEDIADAKLVVRRAVGNGVLVLNAGDPILAARGRTLTPTPTWFAASPAAPTLSLTVKDGWIVRRTGGADDPLIALADVPCTQDGYARHNVDNVLGALAVGQALDLPDDATLRGLAAFGREPSDNPGRGNVFDVAGVTVVVDFAHNPHGMAALVAATAALPAGRRGMVIGQAGDRDDDAIRALARAAWAGNPDFIAIKDMARYRRGRAAGAIPALIEQELRAAGATDAQLAVHDSEWNAVNAAMAWARPGDLVLLTIHAERDRVLDWIAHLAGSGWQPGHALPTEPGPGS